MVETEIREKLLEGTLYHKEQPLLTYTIKYPEFSSTNCENMVHSINRMYEKNAMKLKHFAETDLFQSAVIQYEDSITNGYPIMKYEVMSVYTVTYNEDCTVSLYSDEYQHTGGAHGITVRTSESWNFEVCKKDELADFFPADMNYKDFIIRSINQQIAKQIAEGTNQYFDDYQKLVYDNFKQENFYLTDKGVMIYFQHYDIAPYSSGIVEFLIPYV